VWFDILKYIFKILTLQPDVVLLNPSLRSGAIKRDSSYLWLSKRLLKRKTIVFFHGWDKDLEKVIDKNPVKFVNKFNKADAFLVLSSQFQNKLTEWGVTKPVKLTTTKIDDELINDFNLQRKQYGKTLLFMARVERDKGIFITLKAFKKIKKVHTDAKLVIAGSGSALTEAVKLAEQQGISDIYFKGYVRGVDLVNTYQNADLYILPSYGEGMPTTVLEAMAFGLPVITRPVGGLIDFFENKKMGYLVDSFEPADFGEDVIDLFDNHKRLSDIGRFNHNYAKEHFLPSKVALRMEKLFSEVLKTSNA